MILLERLNVSFGDQHVIQDFSLEVRAGERCGLAGLSGAGKTTLLSIVAGVPNRSASISGGCSIRGKAGYIPQEAMHSLSPFLRVIDQVAEFSESRQRAIERLTDLGLDRQRQQSYPHQLSGGERQRVLIAQALAMRPEILVADEPTSNLDEETEEIALATLDRYANESGAAILIASHDDNVFTKLRCGIQRLTPASVAPLPPPFASPGKAAFRAEHLSKTYFRRDFFLRQHPMTEALRDVSFEIGAAEIVALMGASGSGKTTLARCLSRREAVDSGRVPSTVPVQLVQQEPSESLNPRQTIGDALREASAEADVLDRVGIPSKWLGRTVAQLSEGQRARIAIARACAAARGGLLILDESYSSLDPESAGAVARLIQSEQQESGMACLLITHRAELARALSHRILKMHEGRIE